MRLLRSAFRAFSLIEVIIAITIFSGAIAVMLGLLPALLRQSAASADTLNALRLPDALRGELTRLATARGFDALAAQAIPLTAAAPETLLLVATHDAARLHSLVDQPLSPADRIAEDAQFFLLEVWSFGATPLAFDPSGAGLTLHVRVSWPYRVPGSSVATPPREREEVSFNFAILR